MCCLDAALGAIALGLLVRVFKRLTSEVVAVGILGAVGVFESSKSCIFSLLGSLILVVLEGLSDCGIIGFPLLSLKLSVFFGILSVFESVFESCAFFLREGLNACLARGFGGFEVYLSVCVVMHGVLRAKCAPNCPYAAPESCGSSMG